MECTTQWPIPSSRRQLHTQCTSSHLHSCPCWSAIPPSTPCSSLGPPYLGTRQQSRHHMRLSRRSQHTVAHHTAYTALHSCCCGVLAHSTCSADAGACAAASIRDRARLARCASHFGRVYRVGANCTRNARARTCTRARVGLRSCQAYLAVALARRILIRASRAGITCG